MKKVVIGLLALNLLLPGASLWLLQPPSVAQTPAVPAEQLELERLAQLANQQIQQGQFELAIATLQQQSLIARRHSLKDLEALILASIGSTYSILGQPLKALESHSQALSIFREIKDRKHEAFVLTQIGLIYYLSGQLQKPLEYSTQALLIYREIKDRKQEARLTSFIGQIYSDIGQPQKALENFTQSLFIYRENKDLVNEILTIMNISSVYLALGQPQKAVEYSNELQSITKEVETQNGREVITQNGKSLILLQLQRSNMLTAIGSLYQSMGQSSKALESYNQALSTVREYKIQNGEDTILLRLGQTYALTGQAQKALDYYTQALSISRELQDRRVEAQTLRSLADLERSHGNLQAALEHIEAAIKIVETIRTSLISQEFRTSYFATQQDYYDFYIDLLMQLHKRQPSKSLNALALQASERARARSLLDLLHESQADIRQGVDPKLLEQEKNLQFQLNAFEKRRIELYSKPPTKSQVASFEQDYDTLLSQYQNLETKIRSNSPRYAALTQPQPLTFTELKQQVLDDNTVLLEYFLGKDHSYMWVVSKSEMTSYELPKQSEIEATIQQFRKVVANASAQPSAISKAGTPLSQMLLGPVAKQLGQKRLLIVSNGALQYLPFAALSAPKGSQLLLSEHEIINLPSASTLATLRHELNGRKPAAKTVAVFADPVFSRTDQRVSKKGNASTLSNSSQESINSLPFSVQTLRSASQDAGINFGRLPGTRQEAEDILKLIPADTQTQAFDFKASRENVLNLNLSQYRIIHFATHGILNITRPDLSAVVLSLVDQKGQPQNGFLRLNDIFNLNLPAELVVLSACQTGLGQNIRGEGLIGLTRGFMYAGTPRVLVSLWNVNDESTAVLMTHFYKAMLEQKLPPAAALRAAQLKMQQETKWKSPYHWAAFTLQGEWK
jgi:CHAT domain-containing protein